MASDTPAANTASSNRVAASLKDLVAPFVAVVILVGFIGSTIFMLLQSSLSDIQWSRDIYLFGGIEAIAFAAAGFLFGTQVQRQQVQAANDRAQQADTHAQDATERAMSATATAAATQAKADAVAAVVRSKAAAEGAFSLGELGEFGEFGGLEGLVDEGIAGAAARATAGATAGAAGEAPEKANGRAAATSAHKDMAELAQLVDQLFPIATK
jgi:hypothetical protein